MKFHIKREALKQGLDMVRHAVSTQSSLWHTQAAHLSLTEPKALTITVNDLVTYAQVQVACQQRKRGEVLVDYKLLAALVSTAPADSQLTFTVDPENWHMIVTADVGTTTPEPDPFTATIYAKDASGYGRQEPLPELDFVSVQGEELGKLVAASAYAVSIDDARASLNNVCLTVGDEAMTMVSTDGFRLATGRIPFSNATQWQAILPPSPLQAAVKSLKQQGEGENDIKLAYYENGTRQVVVSSGGLLQRIVLLDTTYVDYQSVIPTAVECELKVNRQKLIDALRICKVVCSGATIVSITYLLSNDEPFMEISITSDSGKNIALVRLNKLVGQPFAPMSLNIDYVLDALKGLSSEYVNVGINQPNDPIVVLPDDELDAQAIIMPMHRPEPRPQKRPLSEPESEPELDEQHTDTGLNGLESEATGAAEMPKSDQEGNEPQEEGDNATA